MKMESMVGKQILSTLVLVFLGANLSWADDHGVVGGGSPSKQVVISRDHAKKLQEAMAKSSFHRLVKIVDSKSISCSLIFTGMVPEDVGPMTLNVVETKLNFRRGKKDGKETFSSLTFAEQESRTGGILVNCQKVDKPFGANEMYDVVTNSGYMRINDSPKDKDLSSD